MTNAISTDVNIDSLSAQIERTDAKFDTFKKEFKNRMDDAVEEVATEFRDEVKNQIKQSGIEKRTGDFEASWKVRKLKDSSYLVHSNEDELARILEGEPTPHTITGDPWLKFQPEETTEYPQRQFFIDQDGDVVGDYAKDGLVVSSLDPLADAGSGTFFAKSVQHPGTKAFEYFERAVEARDWTQELERAVQRTAKKALKASGVK